MTEGHRKDLRHFSVRGDDDFDLGIGGLSIGIEHSGTAPPRSLCCFQSKGFCQIFLHSSLGGGAGLISLIGLSDHPVSEFDVVVVERMTC